MAVSLWRSRLTTVLHRQIAVLVACQRSQSFFRHEDTAVSVSRRKESFVVESDAVKDKRLFMDMIARFKTANPNRRGHVEFIAVALKHLEEFQVSGCDRSETIKFFLRLRESPILKNQIYSPSFEIRFFNCGLIELNAFQVHRDLETYKALFDLFPREKLKPKNLIQAEFHHFPRHQDCAMDILTQMHKHDVMPDKQLRQLVLDIFGPETHVRNCLFPPSADPSDPRMNSRIAHYFIPSKFDSITTWSRVTGNLGTRCRSLVSFSRNCAGVQEIRSDDVLDAETEERFSVSVAKRAAEGRERTGYTRHKKDHGS